MLYKKAKALYKNIIKTNSEHYAALIKLGDMQSLHQKYDKSETTYLQVLKLQPENHSALFSLAKLYYYKLKTSVFIVNNK